MIKIHPPTACPAQDMLRLVLKDRRFGTGAAMAMRREGDLLMTWADMPRSPGHVFYDRLQELLCERRGLTLSSKRPASHSTRQRWRAVAAAGSLFPHAYDRLFRRSRQRARHCLALRDSRSLGDFLRLGSGDKVPDHSWLSKTRSRLPYEIHEKVFEFVLKLVAERGLVKGERIGVDASTMEATAALRSIVRRDSGETYREMLTRADGEEERR